MRICRVPGHKIIHGNEAVKIPATKKYSAEDILADHCRLEKLEKIIGITSTENTDIMALQNLRPDNVLSVLHYVRNIVIYKQK